MAPVVKVREFLAAKANAKGGLAEAKGSTTPLWKLKLQSRTGVTPTVTPVSKRESQHEAEPEREKDVSVVDTSLNAEKQGDDQDAQAQQQPPQAELESGLKLTIIQAPPLLPKPEFTRPAPPTDRTALLRQLQDLRVTGSRMLAATPAAATAASDLNATGAAAPSASQPPLSSTTPIWLSSLAPTAAHAAAQQASLFGTPGQHWAAPAGAAAPAAASPLPARVHAPPQTPSTPAQMPYTSPGGAVGTLAGAAQSAHRLSLSTPSMVGLRQQESRDTGGGFLTHFANPHDIATPSGPAVHGGAAATAGPGRRTPGAWATPGRGGTAGAGGTGGLSTPLSVLRSIHKVHQLQRLQREGSQLVAEIEGRG